MATIRELVGEGDPCGKFKIRLKSWEPNSWFQPFFISENAYTGRDEHGHIYTLPNDNDWELWTEPKPKVKRWLWRHIETREVQHGTEDEMMKALGINRWQKIPGTECEMEG